MKVRIADALGYISELESELSATIMAADRYFRELGDCEQEVDEALDICEEIHSQLLTIHQLYRSKAEWIEERWR